MNVGISACCPCFDCCAVYGAAMNFASAVNGISSATTYLNFQVYQGYQCSKSAPRMSATSNFFKAKEILVIRLVFQSENDRLCHIVLNLHEFFSSRFLCLNNCSAVPGSTYISDYIFNVRYVNRECAATYPLTTVERSSTGTLSNYL